MTLSKKEISILIEIVYSIVFALIFLPYFYENQEKNLILIDGLVEKIIQIIIYLKWTNTTFFIQLERDLSEKYTKAGEREVAK